MTLSHALCLQAGALRCEINPALGGSIAGLWCDDQPVLRSTPALALSAARLSGSFPLVPYSNRIGYGQLHWAGRRTDLPPNFAPEPHAIHGVGWERAWQVQSHSATEASLVYSHQSDAAWPFAFVATQHFSLSAQALEMRMSLTNQAPEPMPAGMGWHPYFTKGQPAQLAFDASGRWDMGPDKLPTQRRPHAGLHCDGHGLDVDHCFDGWSGQVALTQGARQIRIQSDLRYLVVFTTPDRDTIAIEPVSHVNNALALAQRDGVSPESLGVRVLQPGESWDAQMRIELE